MAQLRSEPGSSADPAAARRRGWALVVVALAVVAVLTPFAWLVQRPAPEAGLPLAEALRPAVAPAVPSAGPEPADGAGLSGTSEPPVTDEPSTADRVQPRPYGEVRVRDASLEAMVSEVVSAPARLVVPSLGVDAAVDAVGVEDDGSMVIPAEVDRVGWYRFGAGLGAAEGHTVLAGHVDGAGDGPGALFQLRGVEVGTTVTVVDDSGAEHRYEVVGREAITKDVLPVEEIFDRDGEHRLVLITCGGPFQPELRSYRDNVVVTAVPVPAA